MKTRVVDRFRAKDKKGLMNAGENHNGSIELFLSIDPNSVEIKRGVGHLSSLLSIKTDAEYGERLAQANDATNAKKHAERFFDFVKSRFV